MPRPRFPSDDQRSRPHVRVHFTIRNHPTYGHVFSDPLLRGMWLGMMVVAGSAYAGRTEDTVTLSGADLCWIAGVNDVRYALPRVEKLCKAMDWQLASVPLATRWRRAGDAPATRQWKAEVRNFQRKQYPRSEKRRSQKQKQKQTAEEEETRSEAAPRTPPPSEEAGDFARRFRAALKARTPDAKLPSEPAFVKWIAEADRMFRLDGRTQDEAVELATWLFRDEGEDAAFWRGNVRSVPKFRTRFEQLREHRARGDQKQENRSDRAGGDIRSAVRNAARRRGVDLDGDQAEVIDIGRAARIEAGGDEHES